jgi:P-type Ca2+ transporter type 2C
MTNWYAQEKGDVLQALGSDASSGLSDAVAAQRLAEFGPNELIDRGMKSPLRILWEQFTATMVLILFGAALVSALLGKVNETVSILAIVVLFGVLGFVQEYRAERAMAALKKMSVPLVRVRRSGALRELSARDLVPGDVIVLEAGNIVPADCRIVDSVNLRIQEAILTGESEPVEKETRPFQGADLPLGDRRNMAYMGTLVTYGRGAAAVTETGMRAELGKIATALQAVKQEHTPLQQRLNQLGKGLALAGVVVALLVMALGLLAGEDLREMFLAGVSVAVAVVPEGLPAVVTFTLALGARRMLKRNALIRKLPAVETLGSVTVICSDKTGTLTENRMTVVVMDVVGHRLDLDAQMRQHMPALSGGESVTAQPASLVLLAAGGALCNDATLKPDAQAGRYHTIGDPTEGALLVAAAQLGMMKERLDGATPRLAELPFDSDRKRMTTVHSAAQTAQMVPAILPALKDASHVGFTKGAVDGLLDVSTHVWVNDRVELISPDHRRRIEAANGQLAQGGMRVLGVAFKPLSELPARATGELERDLIFIGLVGMIDPPRDEVRAAVQTCKTAGIRPVMITGDHPLTASAIASELGIAGNGRVLTGRDLAVLGDEDLRAAVDDVSVYARVSPEHKLRIVEALQSKGHVVAMTGDGVNDAPALKRADIGVAMGITGTDVSKEASDMVLLDDNFATIVSAVAEGRTIYNNVRRFVKFSIAGNIGKIAVMLVAPLLGMPLPLLPLQLLWLNLLTDGLLGLGMGVEPAEPNTMRRPPRSPRESIFADGMGRHVIWLGALMTLLATGVGYAYWRDGNPAWQTMVFTTLAFGQVAQSLAVRSARESLFSLGVLTNKPLLGMAAGVVLLQLAVLYLPFMETFFKVTPLTLFDLGISVLLAGVVFAAVELEKVLLQRRAHIQSPAGAEPRSGFEC